MSFCSISAFAKLKRRQYNNSSERVEERYFRCFLNTCNQMNISSFYKAERTNEFHLKQKMTTCQTAE